MSIPDIHDPDIVSACDELPLWSAPFGLKLLEAVTLRRGIDVLDVGCGTGFPLLELAGRLGNTCHLTGIDPWEEALGRIRSKILTMGLTNVTLVAGKAEMMPFADGSFDLIVSNNGINNIPHPAAALGECARVSRRGAQLVVSVNLPGTMAGFYDAYAQVLRARGLERVIPALQDHIHAKRKPAEWTMRRVESSGFRITRWEEDLFSLRYADGTALLGHFFIRLAFLEPWKAVVPAEDVHGVFLALERELNRRADRSGELRLTVPFLCLSAVRT